MRYAISAALLSCQLIVCVALAQFSPLTAPTTPSSAPTTTPGEREQIGTCQGVPVYRDQIAASADNSLTAELHRLLLHRPMETYYTEHKAALVPSDAEIEFTMKFFMKKQEEELEERSPEYRARLARIQEELADSNLDDTKRKKLENEKYNIDYELAARDNPQYAEVARGFWRWWLERWKLQRHLYDNFGGGRILWQQAGLEAFDANRKWIESMEAKGEFTISDPELREKLYAYWTRQPPPFLSDKPERIKEFLSPEWALPAKPD